MPPSEVNIRDVGLDALVDYYEKTGLDQQIELGKKIRQTLFGGSIIANPIEIHFERHHRREFCLPYELIAEETKQLCVDHSLVRILNRPAKQELLSLPVNILIVVASPIGLSSINGDLEIEKIREALGARSDPSEPDMMHHLFATITVVEGPSTLQKIENAVTQKQYQIIELIVHGTDDNNGKGGAVFFEDDRREEEAIDGNHLYAQLTQGDHVPSLVILNSCLTVGKKDTPPGQHSVVAWQLLTNAIPAVIAMQARVSTNLAAKAGAAFYEALFSGGSLDECVRAMRPRLGKEWYVPVLATRDGFNRQFFTEEWIRLLKKVSKINGEVEQQLNYYQRRPPDSYQKLISSLREISSEYYPLVRKRDEVAGIIIDQVSTELGAFV